MDLLVPRLHRKRHATGERVLLIIENQPAAPLGQPREDLLEIRIDRPVRGHESVVLHLLVLLDPLKKHRPLPREHLLLRGPFLDARTNTVALLDREHIHSTDLLERPLGFCNPGIDGRKIEIGLHITGLLPERRKLCKQRALPFHERIDLHPDTLHRTREFENLPVQRPDLTKHAVAFLVQPGKFIGELLLACLELDDQAAPPLDLLPGRRDLAIDLLVLRHQAVPLRGELLDTVGEVLPLTFGIGDIRILVPEPALDILDSSPEILVLPGESRDLGVVKFLLEVVNLPGDPRDLVRSPLEIRFKPRKFLAAGLRITEHLAQSRFQGLLLPSEHLDAL